MKTLHRLTLASLLILAVTATVLFAADATTKPPPAPTAAELALTKERDAAKAELENLKGQQQQQAIITEYWKAVAEKNQAILQIVSLQQQLTEAKAETEKVTKERDALAAAGAKAAALADKMTAPEAKK